MITISDLIETFKQCEVARWYGEFSILPLRKVCNRWRGKQ